LLSETRDVNQEQIPNMKRPFVIAMLALLVCGGLAIFFVWRHNAAPSSLIVTEKDIAETAKRLGRAAPPPQIVAAPIDLKRPVRLAIGSLGFADENQNRRISDLVLAELSGAQGLNLVERQSLDAALREMSMSLSGLVRAKDAVRVGKLLRADWFLLGTEAKFGGTNFVVVRVVDARTGILRDAGIFSANQSPTQLATDIAAFVRQSRQNAATTKPRIYLAIGTFEDLSVNNRQARFPSQLRSYLTTAYQGANVTLLEREAVSTLLKEVRLDLAGLTEEGSANAPQPMQSAYWLVEGHYQSYETTNFEVELVVEVTQMFGQSQRASFRGKPDEPLFHQIKSAIDTLMAQNPTPLWPTRNSEAHAQMLTGKELANLGLGELTWNDYYGDRTEQRRRNTAEAIRAFETVLLLESTNREAKIYLAACLRKTTVGRASEARDYYREIIEDPVQDKWTRRAQEALVASFDWSSSQEKARWFASVARQITNSAVAEFYRQHAESAAGDVLIQSGEGPKAIELAKKRLLEAIRANRNSMSVGSAPSAAFGLYAFREAFNGDKIAAAHELADFLPKIESECPELGPHLTGEILSFQVDTNTPVIAQYEKKLEWCLEHRQEVFQPRQFWDIARYSAYGWLCNQGLYALAARTMEGYKIAASRQDAALFDDEGQVALAFAYMGSERWKEAFAIFESFSNKTVTMSTDGPWGRGWTPVLTGKETAYCREKLGVPSVRDPREFDISANILCMHTPSVFNTDADGLWVAISGQLIRLDFNLKTNLVVTLPIDSSTPITCLCVGGEKVWIGTSGDGLIEFDKTSHHCSHLTEVDGLMMNSLSSLHLTGDRLWIGYAGQTGGGLGFLDLRSRKLKSFMASLDLMQSGSVEIPPKSAVQNILSDSTGDLWLLVATEGLRRLHMSKDSWEAPQDRGGGWTTCFAADAERLVECVSIAQWQTEVDLVTKTNGSWPTNPSQMTTLVLSDAELSHLLAIIKTNSSNQRISRQSSRTIPPKGVLHIYNFQNKRWQSLENAEGLPGPARAMALDGRNVWIGGEGFISLLDLEHNKVLNWCHIQTRSVDHIQIGGGYIWAQFDKHLHRAALADLR
jgi:hypothetical protein